MVLAIALVAGFSMAQQQPPPIKMLSPEECALIVRQPNGEYVVNGTLKFGNMTISNGNVQKGGMVFGGVDPFDVITRSCFAGRGA